MTNLRRRSLTLDLEWAADGMHGHIRDETGASRDFTGWLGLAVALGGVVPSSMDDTRAQEEEAPDADARPRDA